MSKSNLVPWYEWTGTDGLIHAMPVEYFEIMQVIEPGEIQVKDRVAKRVFIPVGKWSKNWEISQYANPVPGERTSKEAIEEDTEAEAA